MIKFFKNLFSKKKKNNEEGGSSQQPVPDSATNSGVSTLSTANQAPPAAAPVAPQASSNNNNVSRPQTVEILFPEETFPIRLKLCHLLLFHGQPIRFLHVRYLQFRKALLTAPPPAIRDQLKSLVRMTPSEREVELWKWYYGSLLMRLGKGVEPPPERIAEMPTFTVPMLLKLQRTPEQEVPGWKPPSAQETQNNPPNVNGTGADATASPAAAATRKLKKKDLQAQQSLQKGIPLTSKEVDDLLQPNSEMWWLQSLWNSSSEEDAIRDGLSENGKTQQQQRLDPVHGWSPRRDPLKSSPSSLVMLERWFDVTVDAPFDKIYRDSYSQCLEQEARKRAKQEEAQSTSVVTSLVLPLPQDYEMSKEFKYQEFNSGEENDARTSSAKKGKKTGKGASSIAQQHPSSPAAAAGGAGSPKALTRSKSDLLKRKGSLKKRDGDEPPADVQSPSFNNNSSPLHPQVKQGKSLPTRERGGADALTPSRPKLVVTLEDLLVPSDPYALGALLPTDEEHNKKTDHHSLSITVDSPRGVGRGVAAGVVASSSSPVPLLYSPSTTLSRNHAERNERRYDITSQSVERNRFTTESSPGRNDERLARQFDLLLFRGRENDRLHEETVLAEARRLHDRVARRMDVEDRASSLL